MPRLRFSCVVDDGPIFKRQALAWIRTLLASGTANADELVVCLVQGGSGSVFGPGDDDEAFAQNVRRLGGAVCPVPRLGTGTAAYCNKLAQLKVGLLREADCCVLCDTDIAFAGNMRSAFKTDAVRAKIVDVDNPPLPVLNALFDMSGITTRPILVPSTVNRRPTFHTNCNGGLYVIPTQWMEPLAESWMHWVRFAFEHRQLLGPCALHIDQIGFSFAMLDLGLPFEPLPEHLNFPTHLPPEVFAAPVVTEPLVLHYHCHTEGNGRLLHCGHPPADAAIERVNGMLGP
jgi:hypothetical protein